MATTEPPKDWIISVWPKPLDESDVGSKRLRLNNMTLMRVGYVLAPEHFSMGIEIPEFGSTINDPRGLIVSFQTRDSGVDWEKEGGVEISMLLGANSDLQEVLPYVLGRWAMDQWKRYALEAIVRWLAREDVRGQLPDMQAMDLQAEGERPTAAGAKSHKRFKITRAHLEEVARIYQEAADEGRPPTREVAELFEVAHSTAAKWVGKARREGILKPVHSPKEATPVPLTPGVDRSFTEAETDQQPRPREV